MIAAQAEFLSSAPPMAENEGAARVESAQTENAHRTEISPQENTTEVSPQPIEADGVWSRVRHEAARLSGLIKVKSTAAQPTVEEEAESITLESSARDFNPLPVEPDSAKSSSEIFAEIGSRLRQRREMLSLTYEEVQRHTRVRAVYLKALEEGALDELPSPVQTRGILANYAGFLDLDADAILLRFADGIQARYRERQLSKPKRSRSHMTVNTSLPPLRAFIASDLVFGGGMAIMLVLFAIWGISRVAAIRSSSRPQATAPSISQVLAGTTVPTLPQEVTLIPAQDTASAPLGLTPTLELPTLNPDINVQITIGSIERTYMRVTVDGKVQFEGRTVPGTAYSYDAKSQIDVLVGNAAALKVTFNGRDLGLMGGFGEVIDRVYTAQGAVTPTSTPPPTATSTPNVTPTPSQTPTRTPSATPTRKPGG